MVTLLDSLVTLAAFWLIILFLSSRINFQRYNILVAPLLIIWRAERIGNFLTKLFHKRFQKFWQRVGSGSAILYLAIFAITPIILLINLILVIVSEPSSLLGQNPITFIDSTILIVIVPIFIALFVHEFAKMIMAAAEGAKIEKAGLMFILILFAPFVQFTSKTLKGLKRRSRIRILSIGMFANLFLAILFIPLFASQSAIVSNFYDEPNGALITSVDPNSPASFNLRAGDVIVGIQRVQLTRIVSSQDINSSAEFITAMRNIPSGETFVLVLQDFRITFQGSEPPKDAKIIAGSYIGVEVIDYQEPKYGFLSPMLPFYFKEFIIWSISINLILGIFSVLPLPLSDGNKILDELLDISQIQSATKSKLKRLAYMISAVLVIANVYYTIL
ncbi:MAG: site-2 protease family protein [Candidatus Heimdallarchaeota archaeon]